MTEVYKRKFGERYIPKFNNPQINYQHPEGIGTKILDDIAPDRSGNLSQDVGDVIQNDLVARRTQADYISLIEGSGSLDEALNRVEQTFESVNTPRTPEEIWVAQQYPDLDPDTRAELVNNLQAHTAEEAESAAVKAILASTVNPEDVPTIYENLGEPPPENATTDSIWADIVKYLQAHPTNAEHDVRLLESFLTFASGDMSKGWNQFASDMEGRYGPGWGWQMAAVLAKEVGVDAALLLGAAALPAVFGPLVAAKGATRWARLGMAVKRVAIVGIGGGIVASGMNWSAGMHPNVPFEVGTRLIGAAGGEAVAGAIGALYRRLRGANIKVEDGVLERLKPEEFEHLKAYVDKYFPTTKDGRPRAVIAPEEIVWREEQQVRAILADAAKRNQNVTAKGNATGRIYKNKPVPTSKPVLPDEPVFPTKSVNPNEPVVNEPVFPNKSATPNKSINSGEPVLTAIKKASDAANNSVPAMRINKAVGSALVGPDPKLQAQMNAVAGLPPDAPKVMLMREASEMAPSAVFNAIIDVNNATIQRKTAQIIVATRANDTFTPAPVNIYDGANLDPSRSTIVFGSPDELFGPPGYDFLNALNAGQGALSGYDKALKNIANSIGRESYIRVEALVEKGAERGIVYTLRDLRAAGYSDAEIDAYYAVRKLWDEIGLQADKLATKTAVENGIREHDGQLVRIVRDAGKGKVVVTTVPRSRAQKRREYAIPSSQLREPKSVIPYRVGHVRRSYDNAWYHVSKIDMKKGTLRRVAVASTRREASEFALKLQSQEPDNVVFWSNWSDVSEAYSMGIGTGTRSFLANASEAELDIIAQALKDAGHESVKPEKLVQLVDSLTYGGLNRKLAGGRADTPLISAKTGKPAAIKPSSEALMEYMASVSREAFLGQWRNHYTKQFLESAKKKGFLPHSARWDDPLKEVSNTSPQYKDYIYHKRLQGWLKEVISGSSPAEDYLKEMATQVVAKMSSSDRAWGRVVADILSPQGGNIVSIAAKYARSVPYHVYLGFLQLQQVFVQFAAQSPIIMGSSLFSPKVFTGASIDLMKLIGTAVARGKRAPEIPDGKNLLDAVVASGWVSNTNIADVDALFSRGASLLTAPVRWPEAANRIMAFAISRRFVLAEIAKNGGKYVDFAGNTQTLFKKGDKWVTASGEDALLDRVFLNTVVHKAKLTALDLGRAGQPAFNRGLPGIATQFTQFFVKNTRNLFVTDKLPLKQKIGALTGLIAVFGLQGLPFAVDILNLGDYLAYKAVGDNPSDSRLVSDLVRASLQDFKSWYKQDVRNNEELTWLERGVEDFLSGKSLLNVLGDAEQSAINRMAMASFISDILHTFDQNGVNAIPILSVLSSTYEAVDNIIDLITVSHDAEKILLSGEDIPTEGELTTAQRVARTALNITREVGGVIPTFGHIFMALSNTGSAREVLYPGEDESEQHRFRTQGGVQTTVNMDNTDLALMILGIKSEALATYEKRQQQLFLFKDRIKKWEDSVIASYKAQRTYEDRAKFRVEVHKDTIEVENYMMSKGFMDVFPSTYKAGDLYRKLNSLMLHHDRVRENIR